MFARRRRGRKYMTLMFARRRRGRKYFASSRGWNILEEIIKFLTKRKTCGHFKHVLLVAVVLC